MSAAAAAPLDLVLLTGISGSGKSVALHALEDAGFYCVDNLPPELLPELLRIERAREPAAGRPIAVAVDVRSAASLPRLMPLIGELGSAGVRVRTVFLDASTDTLVRRFSETRRRHPLGKQSASPDEASDTLHRALTEAIELERELLAGLRETATIVDTSQLRAAQLRAWVLELVRAPAGALTLVFESFAFKQGVPLDADLVFDVRVLPNPHYTPELRPLTGRDAPVAAFLEQQPEVHEMLSQIEGFVRRWLPAFARDQRAYLTVAIGCTGGQHRSVYFVEQLARRFAAASGVADTAGAPAGPIAAVATLLRHRELR